MIEYDAVFYEPSGADKIIETALDELKALFTGKVKATLAEAESAEARLAEIKREINAAAHELDAAREKLEQEERAIESAELSTIPSKYLQRIIKVYTGGYKPGDTVYTITSEPEPCDCETCDATGRALAVVNGKEVEITCLLVRVQAVRLAILCVLYGRRLLA